MKQNLMFDDKYDEWRKQHWNCIKLIPPIPFIPELSNFIESFWNKIMPSSSSLHMTSLF